MLPTLKIHFIHVFLIGLGLVTPQIVMAQEAFPNRPITLIVCWPAGGPADAVARLIGANLSNTLGQPVVIDNKPGAGGNIGSDVAARSKPDGYTIMQATSASHGWNSALYDNLKYKPIEDFAPIGLINTSPSTLLVPLKAAYKTVSELIAAAHKNPGKLNYGSGGVGSSQHMAGAMFVKLSNVDITHIPFKGTAAALTDLMADRVDVVITTGAIPFIRSGKLRALAVAARERHPAMPEVPTFDEAGLKGFYTDNWYGLVAPANTPRTILEKLNNALIKALENPQVRQSFIEQGAFPAKPMTVDQYWSFVKDQMPVAAVMVKLTGAKME